MKSSLFILSALMLLSACTAGNDGCYYIDATGGNDANSGRSADRAWQTLAKLKEVNLQPGDRVLLKRGEVFGGMLELSEKGTAQQRIVVDAYGEGHGKPCITGADSTYSVRLYNSDYVTVRNLEISNTGSRPLPGRTGLKVECTDYGVSHHLILDSLTVRDVNGSLVKSKGGGSGILIVNGGKKIVSVFDSLTIQNCHILRCERNALIWAGYSSRSDWHPSLHTVVRGNLIEGVPGDGIVPIGCDSTLIEYNVMCDCPDKLPDTEAAAGIWPWSCDNTVVQYNEVSGHKAPWDAQGFDSDWNCRNTLIQYNYSHDNYGGLVLVCNDGSADSTFSAGNTGTVVRYNISIGDGIRPRPTRAGMFSPAIHFGGPARHTLIEHNIIHANRKPAPDIDRTLVTSDSWNGYADDTRFEGNLFYAAEPSGFKLTRSTGNVFTGNGYAGKAKRQSDASDALSARYESQILSVDPQGYKGLQRLMKPRQVGGRTFYAVDKEAIEAFFGGE